MCHPHCPHVAPYGYCKLPNQEIAAKCPSLNAAARTQPVDENGETLADRYRLAMEARDVEIAALQAELATIKAELPDILHNASESLRDAFNPGSKLAAQLEAWAARLEAGKEE